jgi:sarcosine oxidase gamma subunit
MCGPGRARSWPRNGFAEIGHWRRIRILARALDLHPDVFTGNVAVTVIAHIGAIVRQCAPERFAIAVFRSYAGSFRHWLNASAAEFGMAVDDAG